MLAATSRLKNRTAGQKLAPRFFCTIGTDARPDLLPQTTETHQEDATYIYKIVSGCAVAPNTAGRKERGHTITYGELVTLGTVPDDYTFTPRSDYELRQEQAEQMAFDYYQRQLRGEPERDSGAPRQQSGWGSVVRGFDQYSGSLKLGAQMGYAVPYVAAAPIVAIYGAPALVIGAQTLTTTTTALAASPIASTTIKAIGFSAALATRTPTGITTMQRIQASSQVAVSYISEAARVIFTTGPGKP